MTTAPPAPAAPEPATPEPATPQSATAEATTGPTTPQLGGLEPTPTAIRLAGSTQAGFSPTPPVDRWLDLDVAPAARGSRPAPSRRVVVTAVLALVAGFGGAGIAVEGRAEPARTAPPAVATVRLDTVVLSPVPSAILVLRVDNLGSTPQQVIRVRVAAGGARSTVVPVGAAAPVGDSLVVPLTVPLDCSDTAASNDRTTVTAELGGTAETVEAVGVGRAGQFGGLCAAADSTLPGGWRSPARAAAWSIADGVVDLTVTGLAAEATRIVWVEADGVLLPQSRTAPTVRGGTARLQFVAPAPGCRDGGVRPVVATGLEVHVETPTGLRGAYVPVGAALGQWLMDAFVAACPSLPGGPAAVRQAGS